MANNHPGLEDELINLMHQFTTHNYNRIKAFIRENNYHYTHERFITKIRYKTGYIYEISHTSEYMYEFGNEQGELVSLLKKAMTDPLAHMGEIIECINHVLASALPGLNYGGYINYCYVLNPREIFFVNDAKLLELYVMNNNGTFRVVQLEKYDEAHIETLENKNLYTFTPDEYWEYIHDQNQTLSIILFIVQGMDVGLEMYGRNLLGFACNDVYLMRRLIDFGYDINFVPSNGVTILWNAIFEDNSLSMPWYKEMLINIVCLGGDPNILPPVVPLITERRQEWAEKIAFLIHCAGFNVQNRRVGPQLAFYDTPIGGLILGAIRSPPSLKSLCISASINAGWGTPGKRRPLVPDELAKLIDEPEMYKRRRLE